LPDPATRLPRRTDKKPDWADVTARFYANSFDAGNRAALLDSAEAWASMDPDEQSFHAAHLAFRQVQALGDIHDTLKGIERGLGALDPKAIAALKHLPGVKRALVVIARGQREMLEVFEANAPGNSVSGDDGDDDDGDDAGDDDDDDGVGRDDDDGDGAGRDDDDSDGDFDDDSELADAVDADEVEEEDHGTGDAPIVPEVIPAGARRAAPSDRGGA
jgi:hypothetical protein